jgi:hypothetical protein
MMLRVLSKRTTSRKSIKGKVTCLTCRLQKCVGNCRFQVVNHPLPPKAA